VEGTESRTTSLRRLGSRELVRTDGTHLAEQLIQQLPHLRVHAGLKCAVHAVVSGTRCSADFLSGLRVAWADTVDSVLQNSVAALHPIVTARADLAGYNQRLFREMVTYAHFR